MYIEINNLALLLVSSSAQEKQSIKKKRLSPLIKKTLPKRRGEIKVERKQSKKKKRIRPPTVASDTTQGKNKKYNFVPLVIKLYRCG